MHYNVILYNNVYMYNTDGEYIAESIICIGTVYHSNRTHDRNE